MLTLTSNERLLIILSLKRREKDILNDLYIAQKVDDTKAIEQASNTLALLKGTLHKLKTQGL